MNLSTYAQFSDKENFFARKQADTMAQLQQLIDAYSHSDGVIYRGVNEAKYMMYSSAQRKFTYNSQAEYNAEIERIIRQTSSSVEISNYFNQNGIPVNDFFLLGLVQHFGGPSPLIDFTDDINTALFFATDGVARRTAVSEIDNYISIYIID